MVTCTVAPVEDWMVGGLNRMRVSSLPAGVVPGGGETAPGSGGFGDAGPAGRTPGAIPAGGAAPVAPTGPPGGASCGLVSSGLGASAGAGGSGSGARISFTVASLPT